MGAINDMHLSILFYHKKIKKKIKKDMMKREEGLPEKGNSKDNENKICERSD